MSMLCTVPVPQHCRATNLDMVGFDGEELNYEMRSVSVAVAKTFQSLHTRFMKNKLITNV